MVFKKMSALVLATLTGLAVLSGCGSDAGSVKEPGANGGIKSADETITLNVVTSYGKEDGNRANYEMAFHNFEKDTGDTINDMSEVSSEAWKKRVNDSFTNGDRADDPDVLFYFAGHDADAIVSAGRVMSIADIRSKYPDYAKNMKDGMLPVSPYDGKAYVVPVNGIWEGLYVNKKVLNESGVAIPDNLTTWSQFIDMCKAVKKAGFTPIAVSLKEVPHYWFEFAVYNYTTPATHALVPEYSYDERARKWARGIADIKDLYELGFFPENTLTAGDSETIKLMVEDKAAFLIDGSWKIGWFQENAKDINNFTITYVPSKNDRKPTDIIADLSMGYYITRTAWDDTAKRGAAVAFVTAMTGDEVVSRFAQTSVTALKNGTIPPFGADSLVLSALEMTRGASGSSRAAQDNLTGERRQKLFDSMADIALNKITVQQALEGALD